MNEHDSYECIDCELTIDTEDTFEVTEENTLEHYNCPICFWCDGPLGDERYPVKGAGYGSWAPAFACWTCFKMHLQNK